jgi:mRNA interferase YafQ
MKKRGKDLSKLKEILDKIISGQELEAQYRDHLLVGQYRGTRECHIEPDWLLIYELAQNEVVLIRTGTHADLFG